MTTILDIGNCDADHGFLKHMLESNFQANVLRAHRLSDAVDYLKDNEVHLILINRLLDVDGSEGMEVFREIKASPEFESTPIMLITNFEDHQQAAVEAGAVRGFGKASLNSEEAINSVKQALNVE